MAVTKLTGLGEVTTNFLLNDYDVYLMNTSATGGYVVTDWAKLGVTGNEKSLNRIQEVYTREAKIPRVPIYEKTIRKGLEISSDVSNLNPDLIFLATQSTRNASFTLTGTGINGTVTGTKLSIGTDETAVEYRAIRFASTRDDGKYHVIDIPKCKITQNGEQTLGGESEVVTPLMFKAIWNSAANATANLYEEYVVSSNSATGWVCQGYN